MSNEKYNWDLVKKIGLEEGPFESKAQFAKYLGMPYNSLFNAFHRGDIPESVIEPVEDESIKTISLLTSKNMTLDEVLDAHEIDRDEWEVTDFSTGLRELLKDEKIQRFSWRVKLKRKFIPFKYQAVHPVKIDFTPAKSVARDNDESSHVVMFITDNHIGKYGDIDLHDDDFLAACLWLADELHVQHIIWGGDLVDLAPFSTFVQAPGYNHCTQETVNIAAMWLSRFADKGFKQTYLKGNHEQRIDRKLMDKMPMLYGLKKFGEDMPLLSIKNLLNLDDMGVDFIDNYPDGEFYMDGIRYIHGDSKCVNELKNATVSTLHGHSHRRYLRNTIIQDTGKKIFTGSPGWAGLNIVPGGRTNSNWQTGAAVITNGQEPEFIRREANGFITFRGKQLTLF